ncbi:hypothetical protein RHMOL_Rhmol08G0121600 [Rhododendron molle]|uniref:Uncharacterized protein n=1 Tax=Rhododendron molle TaxID=49168 RepID=A0ACC0MNN0_RHOML|nr:hypothetical protein RHMOL_Rhmol08G0121600 [Rhododendron molle]
MRKMTLRKSLAWRTILISRMKPLSLWPFDFEFGRVWGVLLIRVLLGGLLVSVLVASLR